MTPRRLEWRHKGWTMRVFELTEGGRVLARFRRRGFGRGQLDVGGRPWRIGTEGLFRRTVRVTDETGRARATFAVGWRGHGILTIADGRRFLWDAETFWRRSWVLDDEAKVQVASVRFHGLLSMDAVVEAALRPDIAEDDLVALLAATWFVLVMRRAAGAAVA